MSHTWRVRCDAAAAMKPTNQRLRGPVTESIEGVYPAPLQSACHRAARFALSLALACGRLHVAESREPARAREEWFNERFDELQMFVTCVCDDWQRGIVSEVEAAKAIHRYLDGVRFP